MATLVGRLEDTFQLEGRLSQTGVIVGEISTQELTGTIAAESVIVGEVAPVTELVGRLECA